MRNILRRSLILVLLLVTFFVVAMEASAVTLDGLEIQIQTDKEEYAAYDPISVTHIITNRNDVPVENIRLETLIPEGYTAEEGGNTVKEVASLAPGEQITLASKLNSLTPKPENGWVTVVLFIVGGLAVAGGIAVGVIFLVRSINKKKAAKILSVLLCVALLGTMILPAQAVEAEKSVLDLSHSVKVGDGSVSLDAKLTYDKIIGEKMNLTVDAEDMLYDQEKDIYHVVEEMDALEGTLLYVDGVEEASCTVTDANGNLLFESSFQPQNMWSVDDIALIIGENHIRVTVDYQDGMHFEVSFVINNICEENMEGLDVDKGDDDDDGVLNFIEQLQHTDLQKADSDDDSLSDYFELAVLGTDPLNPDTDGNGVLDPNEDADADGLTNGEEINQYATNSVLGDSDGDGLSDKAEIFEHGTDPVLEDTDGDGKNDGWELENEYDPLVANTDFPPEEDPNAPPEYVEAESEGEVIITEVADDIRFNEDTPGYIGVNPVDIQLEEGHTAQITITYDPQELPEGEDPGLYYLEEETQIYEPVESVVEDGKVIATVSKSGMYLLLNQRHLGDVWENDIIRPSQIEDGQIDMVFVIDKSSSMDDNDPEGLRKQVTKAFIQKLRMDQDRAGIVQFSSIGEVVMNMSNDADALCNAVDSISNSSGCDDNAGTNGSAGLREALNMLAGSEAKYKYIIFLTDGKDTTVSEDYGDAAGTYGITGEARGKGIVIHTVGLIGTGEVDVDLLMKVAAGTGGNYYGASVGDEAEKDNPTVELEEIYDQIESVTIDRHLDSNNDGISDYYTRLICEGRLISGTGLGNLFGDATYDEIQANADLDEDGLLNGEELQVVETERGVFVTVVALPYKADSDGDGLLDHAEFYSVTSPLKKNGNVKVEDVAWLTDSENFKADLYLDNYNGSALERGAVWIANAFFGTTLDQTNLYRKILSEYFTQIDEQLMSSASETTFENFADAFFEATFQQIQDGLVQAAESDDQNLLEQELQNVSDLVGNVLDWKDVAEGTAHIISQNKDGLQNAVKKLMNLSNDWNLQDCQNEIKRIQGHMEAISKGATDATRDYQIKSLNEFSAELAEYRSKSQVFSEKIKLNTDLVDNIGKGLEVLDNVTTVIDVAQDSWKAYSDYCEMVAVLDTLEKNIYILDCIIATTDNHYLWGAAVDMRCYVSQYFSEDVRKIVIALDQAEDVVLSFVLDEVVHDAIGKWVPWGTAIELVRTFGNVAYKMDEIAESASKTVALAATADILAKNYVAQLEGKGAVNNGKQYIAYASYSDKMYISILNLALARKMGEEIMRSWQESSTIISGCDENIGQCEKLINRYNTNYFDVFLKEE